MPTGQKIRIYDLAKELKLDNKKVMEDARREGIDVSVPSNTVPHEVAERIRTKYFPKKVVKAVGPRLVKTVKQPEPVEAQVETEQVEAISEKEPEAAPSAAPSPGTVEPPKPKVRMLKATPQPQPSVDPPAQDLAAETQQEP
ncbi:MAG TPA: translation initiation factor IF-2 N-terminal domain-containing protein [Blastocatellia bacterium]|nr:translation initiation factor IF-2 N-terminal domain-containing protein [Blastocatellia bacterium]